MTAYADDFRQYLIHTKKASPNTVDSYSRDVTQFLSYCAAVKAVPEHVDHETLCRYLETLTLKSKSEATKTRVIASVRCFYRFLNMQGMIAQNPADGLKIKMTEKKLPGVLDANEIILLLSQADGNDYKSLRDKAILELLYATGIRVSELIDLRVSDVNLQVGLLHLKTGDRERILPIYPAAVKTMAKYLVHVRPAIIADTAEDRLFTNMAGQPLSRQGLWKIIKHYAQKAGIQKDITPQTLRHSFAAHLLENGAQLKDIQEMLGHSDISSTQVYAQFMKNKYTLAYAKYHPLAH
ncbi:MAG: tyrosine recombinase [Clostridia bacterium]|nr:tyrosine recombinase [Clostridia bacterium]